METPPYVCRRCGKETADPPEHCSVCGGPLCEDCWERFGECQHVGNDRGH